MDAQAVARPRAYLPMLVPIIAIVIVGAALAVVAVLFIANIQKSRALAYGCGYTAGQRAVMVRMPHLFTTDDLPDEMRDCRPHRLNAAGHGFMP